MIKLFEQGNEDENTLDLNNFSVGALTISAYAKERPKLEVDDALDPARLLRLLVGAPNVVETSIVDQTISDDGYLNFGVSMHDQLKYRDYDLFVNIQGFESYDSKSDKILTLNLTKDYVIVNSGDSIPGVAGALAGSKDSIGLASDLIGMALLASNPVTAGSFV
jgi:hypothetical protein